MEAGSPGRVVAGRWPRGRLLAPLLHCLGEFDNLSTKVGQRGQDLGGPVDTVVIALFFERVDAGNDVVDDDGAGLIGPSLQRIDALDQFVDGIRQRQEAGDPEGIIDADLLPEALDRFPVRHSASVETRSATCHWSGSGRGHP